MRAGHGQRGGDAYAHVFVALPIGGRCRNRSRSWQARPAQRRYSRWLQGRAGAAPGIELDHGATDANAGADWRAAFIDDEQRVGGGRVAIAGILQEPAADAVVRDRSDDAFHHDRLACEQTAFARALDLADGRRRVLRQYGTGEPADKSAQERQERKWTAHAAILRGRNGQRRPEAALRKNDDGSEEGQTCSSIQSTVALTWSSERAGLPPLAGITPALPVKPSIAC